MSPLLLKLLCCMSALLFGSALGFTHNRETELKNEDRGNIEHLPEQPPVQTLENIQQEDLTEKNDSFKRNVRQIYQQYQGPRIRYRSIAQNPNYYNRNNNYDTQSGNVYFTPQMGNSYPAPTNTYSQYFVFWFLVNGQIVPHICKWYLPIPMQPSQPPNSNGNINPFQPTPGNGTTINGTDSRFGFEGETNRPSNSPPLVVNPEDYYNTLTGISLKPIKPLREPSEPIPPVIRPIGGGNTVPVDVQRPQERPQQVPQQRPQLWPQQVPQQWTQQRPTLNYPQYPQANSQKTQKNYPSQIYPDFLQTVPDFLQTVPDVSQIIPNTIESVTGCELAIRRCCNINTRKEKQTCFRENRCISNFRGDPCTNG